MIVHSSGAAACHEVVVDDSVRSMNRIGNGRTHVVKSSEI